MNKKVSIIIPVYNAENYIDLAISSVLNQTYKNIEIIVVNDGSTDNTNKMLAHWKNIDNRIKIINIKNNGVSNARNVGIKEATGDLLFFLDSDDAIHKSTIELMLNNYNDKSTLVVCGFDRFKLDSECELNNNLYFSFALNSNSHKVLKQQRNGFYSWGILYENEIVKKHNIQFDVSLGNLEDVVWNAIYLSYIKRIAYLNVPMYKYRVTPNSITSKSLDSIYQANCYYYAYKSICKEIKNRNFSVFQKKIIENIKFVCIKGLCGELYNSHITTQDFIKQLPTKDKPSKLFELLIKLFYLLLFIFNNIHKNPR